MRICVECSNTDRGLSRTSKTNPAAKRNLAAKSKEERAAWYQDEKKKRKAADVASKRDFAFLEVAIVEKETVAETLKNVDSWEIFKDWAVRQMTWTPGRSWWRTLNRTPGRVVMGSGCLVAIAAWSKKLVLLYRTRLLTHATRRPRISMSSS
jgi:hypothetical protein